jgi:hypothetical protein
MTKKCRSPRPGGRVTRVKLERRSAELSILSVGRYLRITPGVPCVRTEQSGEDCTLISPHP